MQLFTGQPSVPESKLETQPEPEAPKVAPVVQPPEPVKVVEAPKPAPEPIQKPIMPPKPLVLEQTPVENHSQSTHHEDLNIVNKLIEKHESRIKESQSEVVQTSSKFVSHERSSTNVVTKNSYNHVVEHQGSICLFQCLMFDSYILTHFMQN